MRLPPTVNWLRQHQHQHRHRHRNRYRSRPSGEYAYLRLNGPVCWLRLAFSSMKLDISIICRRHTHTHTHLHWYLCIEDDSETCSHFESQYLVLHDVSLGSNGMREGWGRCRGRGFCCCRGYLLAGVKAVTYITAELCAGSACGPHASVSVAPLRMSSHMQQVHTPRPPCHTPLPSLAAFTAIAR